MCIMGVARTERFSHTFFRTGTHTTLGVIDAVLDKTCRRDVASGSGSIQATYFECSAGMARGALATVVRSDLGGEMSTGRSIDTATMPAITCRPLA